MMNISRMRRVVARGEEGKIALHGIAFVMKIIQQESSGVFLVECSVGMLMVLVHFYQIIFVNDEQWLCIPLIQTLLKSILTKNMLTTMSASSWYLSLFPSVLFVLSQVGEAPVQLRDDQYLKLKELGCCCDIYVNHMGEVCVRSIDKDPPRGGMIFAATDWHANAPRLVNDYPQFQGVRGVCAKIFFDPSLPHQVNNPTGIERTLLDVTQSLKSVFSDTSDPDCEGSAGSPLDRLLEKRNRLNDELGVIERKHLLFKTCKPHRATYETAIAKNLELIALYSSGIDIIPRSEEVLQTTQLLNQEMIIQLVEMNRKLNEQLSWLTNQSSMNSKLYKVEKERVETELDKVKQKLKKIKK